MATREELFSHAVDALTKCEDFVVITLTSIKDRPDDLDFGYVSSNSVVECKLVHYAQMVIDEHIRRLLRSGNDNDE